MLETPRLPDKFKIPSFDARETIEEHRVEPLRQVLIEHGFPRESHVDLIERVVGKRLTIPYLTTAEATEVYVYAKRMKGN